jgi:hypothetical protein
VTKDAHISLPVLELLGNQWQLLFDMCIWWMFSSGLAGFYPLHPKTFIRARHACEADDRQKLQSAVPVKEINTESAVEESSPSLPMAAAQADAWFSGYWLMLLSSLLISVQR